MGMSLGEVTGDPLSFQCWIAFGHHMKPALVEGIGMLANPSFYHLDGRARFALKWQFFISYATNSSRFLNRLETGVPDFNLSLDAFHETRIWSILILGFSGALSTVIGFILIRYAAEQRQRRDAKIAVFFGSIAIVCAIVMISRIPAPIPELPLKDGDDVRADILFMKTPLSIYDVVMQISTIVAGIFILSIAWRTAFGRSFVDLGILSVGHQAKLRQKQSELDDRKQKKEMRQLSKDAAALEKKINKLNSDISTLKEHV
jgi:hypothetical protein